VKTGRNSRPGNATLQAAAVLKSSAIHERINKYIKIGLIERTEVGDGRGRASVYAFNWSHSAFPDRSPNGEILIDMEDREPSALDRTVSETTATVNLPASTSKASGHHDKPSGQIDKLSGPDRNTSVPHPKPTTPPSEPRAEKTGAVGRWEGFVSLLPIEMEGAIPRKDQRNQLEALISKHGAKSVAYSVKLWSDHREMPVDGIPPKMGKWKAFLNECTPYLGRLEKEKAERKANEDQYRLTVERAEAEYRRMHSGILNQPEETYDTEEIFPSECIAGREDRGETKKWLSAKIAIMGEPTEQQRQQLEEFIKLHGLAVADEIYRAFENRPQGLDGLKNPWHLFLKEAPNRIESAKRTVLEDSPEHKAAIEKQCVTLAARASERFLTPAPQCNETSAEDFLNSN